MQASKGGLVRGLISITATILFVVWGVTSLTNGDALWFLRRFDAQAERLVVYWDGDVHTIERGEVGYQAIMDAFADAVAHPAGYEGKVGLSEISITTYKEQYRLLEVVFAAPVQVHTRHPMPEAATYLVPLNQGHARFRRAFAFPGRVPHTIGPLTLGEERFEALYATVASAVAVAAAD